MDIHTIVMYVFIGLCGIIGYLVKEKLSNTDNTIADLGKRIDKHNDEDTLLHMKIVELYVTKQEYTQTIGRIFDMLNSIATDIKGLLTSKVDK